MKIKALKRKSKKGKLYIGIESHGSLCTTLLLCQWRAHSPVLSKITPEDIAFQIGKAVYGGIAMFIGHYGVGFALKKLEKRMSLGFLFILVMLPDILLYIFVLLGIEKVSFVKGITKANPLYLIYYPFSHSLISNILLALFIFIAFRLLSPSRTPFRLVIVGIAVLSHFFLDFLVHIPDMPILFDSMKVGLGLWNNLPLSYSIETAIFVSGFLVYIFTVKEYRTGKKIGISVLAAIMLAINFSTLSGTVPPGVNIFVISNLAVNIVIIGLAFWLDDVEIEAGNAAGTITSGGSTV